MPVPTPEEQILFLARLQRILDEGIFTASYKFALLHALADLALERGDDSGAPLEIATREIAGQFIRLYWDQTDPFPGAREAEGTVLKQNTGRQAAVVGKILRFRDRSELSLAGARLHDPGWEGLVGEVDRVVRDMPLWKLQRVGDEVLEFLYRHGDERGGSITLLPGAAFCLRTFYPLIRDLIHGAWVGYVRKTNLPILGGVDPVSWTLHPLEGRSERCHEATPPTRLSSGSRWWSSSGRAASPGSWPRSSSPRSRPSGTGSNRPTWTTGSARTA